VTTRKKECASSTTQPALMDVVQEWLDANDQSGEVRQKCIDDRSTSTLNILKSR
jgi:hypothetical protein